MEIREVVIPDEGVGQRLDAYLAWVFVELFSRTKIKKMIDEGMVRVEDKQVPSHYRLKAGEHVVMTWEPEEVDVSRAEDIPLDILFEDDDLIVVNKPAGMVVHPAQGNFSHTLVNALLHHTKNLSGVGGTFRPGIVHRLDKDTSGVLVVAKNDRAHARLAADFKKHSIERSYYALVRGVVQHDEGICEEPVACAFLNRRKIIVTPSGGKEAVTCFKVMKRFQKATWLKISPQTGRTHQIRVHMAYMGHPVLGDAVYGVPSPWISRQALHAVSLGFNHPVTHAKLFFETPMPEDMQSLITRLESEK